MSRDIYAEAAILTAHSVHHPGDLELRKRRDLAVRARGDHATREIYLSTYDPPEPPEPSMPKKTQKTTLTPDSRPSKPDRRKVSIVPDSRPSDRAIVEAWVTSTTSREAAEKLDVDPRWLALVAARMRKQGVKIEKLPNGKGSVRSRDVKGLNQLIAKLKKGGRAVAS